jgi:hypothetical protein
MLRNLVTSDVLPGASAGVQATLVDFSNTVSSGGLGVIIPARLYTEDGYRLRNGTTGSANGLFDANWMDLSRPSDRPHQCQRPRTYHPPASWPWLRGIGVCEAADTLSFP